MTYDVSFNSQTYDQFNWIDLTGSTVFLYGCSTRVQQRNRSCDYQKNLVLELVQTE